MQEGCWLGYKGVCMKLIGRILSIRNMQKALGVVVGGGEGGAEGN